MLDLRFSPDHSWVRRDDDGLATVGISPYAQEQLGDIVYIEAPDVGREITQGEDIGVLIPRDHLFVFDAQDGRRVR